MNSKILRSIWRLSSLHHPGKLSQIASRGYAIPIDHKVNRLPAYKFSINYSTKVDRKERTPTNELAFKKLQADFTAHGNVHRTNYEKLLESLQDECSLTTEQSIFLLEACADLMPVQSAKSRMELFIKLWNHLKSAGTLKKPHYIAFLKVHAANGVPLEDFRKFLDESGLSQDSEVYEKLIQYACELGDMKMTTDILAVMREKSFSLTENVFNALIQGHSRNKDLKGALAIVETMNAAGVRLSASTYAQLVGAYIEHNDLEKALETLQRCSGQLSPKQIVALMKILTNATRRDYQKLMEILIKQLPSDFLNAKEVPSLILNICTELIYTGRIQEAMDIIKAFPCPKFNENQDIDTFGVSLLQDLFRSKVRHEQIIDVAKYLTDSGKNTRALHIACDTAMRRNPDKSIPYLKALSELEPLRPHYFWPLLLHRFKNNGEAGMLQALKTMSTLGVTCDYETISFYVLPRLSITLEDTQQAIKKLEDSGLKTSQLLSPLISHLIFQQKLEEVVKISQLYTSKLDTKQFIPLLANIAVSIRATRRYQKFSDVIHALHLKSQDPKIDFVGQLLLEVIGNNKLRNDIVALSHIITDLSRLGARMSPAAIEILNGHIGKIKNDKVDSESLHKKLATMIDRQLGLPASENPGSYITHPRDMSYEQLECHLVELEAKGMNTRGVLRRLLQVCIRDGLLKRAVEIKRKCDEAKVDVSPGMLASTFDMYIKLKDFPTAEATYKQLLKTYPGFLLDEHKLIDFAALTVQQNKLDEAKKLLADRAATRKVFGGDYVIKNVWNLLTSVAQLAAKQTDLPKDKNLTKEVFFFIRKLGYCNSHNAVLGPIIREYILRKDIRAAVAEFQTLAELFKHTPLQFELSSILVRLSNSEDSENFNISQEEAKELLQQLTTTVSSIHSPTNMNSSLLLAVAESGTENQLRRLLINPEFKINNEMLMQNCEHLNKEGSIRTLMRLAKACRGLGHVIKEQDIYNMLLMKFVNDNNCVASLELFEKLEADDELKMSQDFLKNLVNLLKVNQMEIPSGLALRAQVL